MVSRANIRFIQKGAGKGDNGPPGKRMKLNPTTAAVSHSLVIVLFTSLSYTDDIILSETPSIVFIHHPPT